MSKRIDIIKAFAKHDSKIHEHWKSEFWVMDHMKGYGFIAESKIQFKKNKESGKDLKKFDKNSKLDLSEFKKYRKTALISAKQMQEPFEVITPEGTMQGKKEDYLAIGVHGEVYPIQKAIFEKSYELATPELADVKGA